MTTPVVHHGDCIEVMRGMADNSIDAIVCDPPYSLTNGGKQDCASDMLRDAIVMDAAHSEPQSRKGSVKFRITFGGPWAAVSVGSVNLDHEIPVRQQEVSDQGTPIGQGDNVLMDKGDAMPRQECSGGQLRLWVRKGHARCVGACRCLGQDGAGLLRIPVWLDHYPLSQAEGAASVMAGGGAEVAAMLSLDVRRRTGELLPASGADAINPAFHLLGTLAVGAGSGAGRLATVTEPSGVGNVGDSADGAIAFDLLAHDVVLSWRPTSLRGFMSKAWDGTGVETDVRLWRECLRVLKPGGHLLAAGSSRTFHRLVCAVEDAGFEIRDTITWHFGSGFPKSLDVSKAIDKASGVERVGVGARNPRCAYYPNACEGHDDAGKSQSGATFHRDKLAAGSNAARQWHGWGTALKPATEFFTMARKPLIGTVAANVIAHGTGALNIDACRITATDALVRPAIMRTDNAVLGKGLGAGVQTEPAGRWPANVALSEDQAAALDQQSGILHSQDPATRKGSRAGSMAFGERVPGANYADKGGASRFFYVAKAPAKERPSYFRQSCSCEGAYPCEETSQPRDTADSASVDGKSWNTFTSGSNTTGVESRSGTTSITATGTSSTTTSATSNSSPSSNTSASTPGASNATASGGSPVESALSSSLSAPTIGISVPKAGRSMAGVAPATSQKWSQTSSCGECGSPARRESHATVKPLALMRWLVKLVTPPGGTILDPFCGSGTTIEAAMLEGFDVVGIEREADYLPLIQARIERNTYEQPDDRYGMPPALFDDDGEASA